jgi:outer membrane protein assembly factor BamB
MRFETWLGVLLLSASASTKPDAQWPQFRGPHGSGLAAGKGAPVALGEGKGLRWKATVGPGHSSPTIWGDRVFLTAGDKENRKLSVLCLDRKTGKLRWERSVTAEKIEPLHEVASPAMSTPVVDGKRVVAHFGSHGLVAFDLDGKPEWKVPLPVTTNRFGSGTSPVLAGEAVLLSRDEPAEGYLLAVDRSTGKTLWKQPYTVPNGPGAAGTSTPVVWQDEVIVHRGAEVAGFGLKDGTRKWWVLVRSTSTATPVVGSGVVYVPAWFPVGEPDLRVPLPDFASLLRRADKDGDGALSPEEFPNDIQLAQRPEVAVKGANLVFPGRLIAGAVDQNKDAKVDKAEWEDYAASFANLNHALLAIRLGGQGDVTATHVLWREGRGVPEVPTPLVSANRVYMVTNGGIVTCMDAQTGAVLFRNRLGAGGAYYASPVMAGGNVYFASGDGVVTVIRDVDTFTPVAKSELGAPIMATPAILEGIVYLRAGATLFAFGD